MENAPLTVVFNTIQKKYSDTLQTQVPEILLRPKQGSVQIGASQLVELVFRSNEEYLKPLLKSPGVPEWYRVATKVKLGVVGALASFNVELREVKKAGLVGYEAQIVAGGQTFLGSFASGIAAAAANAAALYLGATVGTAALITIGTGVAVSAVYDNSPLKDKATGLLTQFAPRILSSLGLDPSISNQLWRLDTSQSINADLVNTLAAFDKYTVIPEAKGGQSVSLTEKDRVIFLGEKPIMTIYYTRVQGGRGVTVDLDKGTTHISNISGIKDYLGDAVIDVFGSEFSDVITGDKEDNKLYGEAGNDTLRGGDGNDILTGSATLLTSGVAEVDVLIGGVGRDQFILANQSGNFYSRSNGSEVIIGRMGGPLLPRDYGFIGDFRPEEGDIIQLKGTKGEYLLRSFSNKVLSEEMRQIGGLNPNYFSVGIIHNRDGKPELSSGDEIIGVIGRNLPSIFFEGGLTLNNSFKFI